MNAKDRLQYFEAAWSQCQTRERGRVVGNGFASYLVHTALGTAKFHGYAMRAGRRPAYHIHWLVSRQRGAGRKTMQLLCALADHFRIWLHLYPVPVEGGQFHATQDQLHRFYGGFGFVLGTDGKRNPDMWREPR